MPTRERPADRGARSARSDLLRLGVEIRAARVAAGLSLQTVGDAIGSSIGQLSRVERGEAPGVSAAYLARAGAVVGLDVRIRAYPGGDPIRDAAQTRLLDRLRARLPARQPMRHETPLLIDRDQRAWDARIDGLADPRGGTCHLVVEAETHLTDVQMLMRRAALKLRDGGEDRLLLVVANTRHNRDVVRAARAALDDSFPVDARTALADLSAGRCPAGSSLVFL